MAVCSNNESSKDSDSVLLIWHTDYEGEAECTASWDTVFNAG